MTVASINDSGVIDPIGREELVQLMEVVSLCNETRIRGTINKYELEGSPTENALVDLALNAGIDVIALREEQPTLHTRFCAEERPYMSTLHSQRDGKHLLAVKGSPTEVLAAGWGQPMNPMQLLWINLVTDIFPGLALSLEAAEPDIMARGPRDPKEAIIGADNLKRILFESATIGLGTMGSYLYGIKRYGTGASASTLAFNTLTLNELAHALSSRSRYRHIFGGQKLPPNPHLTRAIIGMMALQAIVAVVPGARRLLGTTPLGIGDLAAIAGGVLLPLIVNESTKPSMPAQAEEEVETEQEVTT